jgi:CheY-like chemotaxis protein
VKGHRILIVEDEFIVAYEIQQTLEDRGFTVCGMVASGEAAVITAERERPDCVLMDVNVRGTIGGIEAARRIGAGLGVPESQRDLRGVGADTRQGRRGRRIGRRGVVRGPRIGTVRPRTAAGLRGRDD